MNLTIKTATIYIYFVFVGTCYLFGFWTPLHFNILQFVSPVDILKSAIYPMVPAALGVFFYVVMDAFNSQGVDKPKPEDPKVIRNLFWIANILIIISTLIVIYSLVVCLYELYMSEPEKRLSYALPIASVLSVIYMISKPPFMQEASKFTRNFTIILICTLPSLSYSQGERNIKEILENKASYYKLKIDSKNCKVNALSNIIFLGLYDSKYLFIDSESKDICIETDGSINLKYYEYKKKQ